MHVSTCNTETSSAIIVHTENIVRKAIGVVLPLLKEEDMSVTRCES